MYKKFGLILALMLFFVQVLSTLHMAEHGFSEHKHNGHICDIYVHAEHAKFSKPDVPALADRQEYTSLATVLPAQVSVHSQIYSAASPRAPPAFS